jgi:DNA-directed RNA polymerase alpha subunit
MRYPIYCLPLSARARNALVNANVLSPLKLLQTDVTVLAEIPNVGSKTLDEILDVLETLRQARPEIAPVSRSLGAMSQEPVDA